MVQCPQCDNEVEPTWEACAGCGLDADGLGHHWGPRVEPDDLVVRGPYTPPPYHGGRPAPPPRPRSVSPVLVGAALFVILALVWIFRPEPALLTPLLGL